MIHQGRVTAFDREEGLGTVTTDDGCELPFHCTAIAGGTRTIDPGTEVVFEIVPGPAGRWWSASVTPR